MSYEVLVLPFMLETATTVTILTIHRVDEQQTPGSDLYRLNALNDLTYLHTISPNILYSAGPHVTGNKREVLCTVKSMFQTIGNDIIKTLATGYIQKLRSTRSVDNAFHT